MTTYLLNGLIVTALALAALTLPGRQRAVALASGLAAAPTGLLDVLFAGRYWHPDHLFGAAFSVEGMLFSFGNGVLLWLVASRPLGATLPRSRPLMPFMTRMLLLGAAALAPAALLWHFGLALMPAVLAGLALTGAWLLARDPRLAPVALAGGVFFTALYAGQLLLMRAIDPGYPGLWQPAVRAGLSFAGYPGEELAWAAVYGAVWPLCVARSLGARAVPAPANSAAS